VEQGSGARPENWSPGRPLGPPRGSGKVRESIVVSVLGAQLTIGGAIVHYASETTGDTDPFGVPMIFVGVVLGVLAGLRAYKSDRREAGA
jgi:hypothetical protein